MIGVELVEPGTGDRRPGRRPRAVLEAHEAARRCWSARAACYGNVLRIAPPLSLTARGGRGGRCVLEGASMRTSSRRRSRTMTRPLIRGGLVITAADELPPTC